MKRSTERRTSSYSSSSHPSSGFGASYRSQHGEHLTRSIVEDSIARDLDEEHTEDTTQDAENTASGKPHRYSLAGGRRPSFVASGPRPFLGIQGQSVSTVPPTEHDREAAIIDERTLLQDNNLIQDDHFQDPDDQENSRPLHATETTALLNGGGAGPERRYSENETETIDKKWEDAILSGQIHTTWQRESKVLASYAAPLTLTFVLQQSLTLTSVFTVGHIGKNELGAVSLGGMTATITGYAVYHGLATSLDTLCAQAYGSGHKKLVGLNLQRMVFFLWACTVPIAVVWFFAEQILIKIVPEKEIAVLAGRYLQILILGAPAYALFESSKRYVQAQGRFAATTYVLLIAAPANMLMHWLFVWQFGWGFIGCPIAVVITENLMPLLLLAYVRFVGGMECWPGFSRKAFKNWGPMIRLALPGFVMVVAEFLAFEIITLASAQISATHLAANTVLQSLTVLAYGLPFPFSIAGSTRVANLIGATLPDAAKVSARVLFVFGTIVGLFNMIMLSSLRFYIPHLFTKDPDVIKLAAATLPINAAFQLFDALAAQCNGILRGLGKQSIGGYICLFAFYGIAIPISFGTAFGLGWELYGLWTGPAVALFVQFALESAYIYNTSWQKASEEASQRNAAG